LKLCIFLYFKFIFFPSKKEVQKKMSDIFSEFKIIEQRKYKQLTLSFSTNEKEGITEDERDKNFKKLHEKLNEKGWQNVRIERYGDMKKGDFILRALIPLEEYIMLTSKGNTLTYSQLVEESLDKK